MGLLLSFHSYSFFVTFFLVLTRATNFDSYIFFIFVASLQKVRTSHGLVIKFLFCLVAPRGLQFIFFLVSSCKKSSSRTMALQIYSIFIFIFFFEVACQQTKRESQVTWPSFDNPSSFICSSRKTKEIYPFFFLFVVCGVADIFCKTQ